ncbi:MAG: hypothetical protein NVS2B7_38530 [Herpetosiphon sp.]
MPDFEAETSLRIGELAAQLALNPRTIRYYEGIGLLPHPSRTTAGYRLYTAADRERLQFIGKAKAIGLSLEEIREILELRSEGGQPCAHVLKLVDLKLAALDRQLRALEDFRRELLTLRLEAAETMIVGSSVCGIIERHEHLR